VHVCLSVCLSVVWEHSIVVFMSLCLFVCASSESGVLWCACLSVCLSVRHLRAEYCGVHVCLYVCRHCASSESGVL